MKVEILPASVVETAALTELRNSEYLARHASWQYRSGFSANLEPLVALVEGRLVGHAGVLPLNISLGQQKVLATWFVDFNILPELQRKGIGQQLTAALEKVAPVQLATCNERSLPLFLKAGWLQRTGIVRYGLPINPWRLSTGRNILFRLGALLINPGWRLALWWKYRQSIIPEILPAKVHLDQLEQLFAVTDDLVVRDRQWFDWRIKSCPHLDDIYFTRDEASWVLFRLVNINDMRRLHILYLAGEQDALARMMNGLNRWAIQNGIDLVWSVSSRDTWGGLLKRFLPMKMSVNFAVNSPDDSYRQQLSTMALDIQAIDSDVDTQFTDFDKKGASRPR